jgi:hypothetical protein
MVWVLFWVLNWALQANSIENMLFLHVSPKNCVSYISINSLDTLPAIDGQEPKSLAFCLCKVFPYDKNHLELLDIESMCDRNLCVAVNASRSQSNDSIAKAQLNRNHLDICIGMYIQLCRLVI